MKNSNASAEKKADQDIVLCKKCARIVRQENFTCTDCGENICLVCGCTESAACFGGCYWVRPGVCSHCD